MTFPAFKLALVMLFSSVCLILSAISAGSIIPTGEMIAYLEHPQERITWSILVRDLDRALAYDLTEIIGMTGVRNRLPAWSPDGSRLAFLSERGGLDIFVVDLDTYHVAPITSTGEIIYSLDWSPDGTHILFDLAGQTGERGLYIVDVQTRQTSSLLTNSSLQDILPKWSANGDVAFSSSRSGSTEIYLWHHKTNEVKRLTQGLAATGYIAWSPDGMRLAFTAIDLTPSNAQIIYTDLYILDLAHPDEPPLRIEVVGNEREITWSPDGSRIAFVNDDGDDEIYVVDGDGTNLRKLTDNVSPDYSPAWSPDGTRLIWVFARSFGVTSDLYLFDLAENRGEQLTFNAIDDWSPVWRP
jgi:Tol biopolymer transport system component